MFHVPPLLRWLTVAVAAWWPVPVMAAIPERSGGHPVVRDAVKLMLSATKITSLSNNLDILFHQELWQAIFDITTIHLNI